MKKLLAVALATVMTQQALAVNWYLLGEASNGDFKEYIDLDSIQKDYLTDGTPVMTAWTQIEYKQVQNVGDGKKIWSAKHFVYYDCRARKLNIEYIVSFNKQGRVVSSGNSPLFSRYSSTNWDRVIPGSISEAWLNFVCAYAN